MAARPGRNEWAELIQSTAGHREPSDHVLCDGFVKKMFRGNNAAASCSHIVGCGHAEHTTEMVGVRMRVDHRGDRALPQRGVRQRQTITSAAFDCERVDHDPPGVAFNERDVGDVVATRLPDTGRHLEQAVNVVQLCLTPQAGMHRVGVRCTLFDEVVFRHIPGHTPRTLDLTGGVLSEQTP